MLVPYSDSEPDDGPNESPEEVWLFNFFENPYLNIKYHIKILG